MKWGILSTANIGVEKVIPSMMKSAEVEILAISSRNIDQAKKWADKLNISRAYGSYEELIANPEVEIIYNPLPNHLHVEWTAKAIQAGKHVLCEKPLFLNPEDADQLIRLRDKHQVKVGEAFMVKSHPQWLKAQEIIQSGKLGEVKSYNGAFCYYNTDPNNIRNIDAYGGGALWDIGCYPIMTSRFLFGENPAEVLGTSTIDKEFNTDTLTSAIMNFPSGKRATFTVSTQLAPYQRVQILGTEAEMEILIPFNAPEDRPVILKINRADIYQERIEKVEIPKADQYQLQAEAFQRSILQNLPEPNTLEDAKDHCLIINALIESNKSSTWKPL